MYRITVRIRQDNKRITFSTVPGAQLMLANAFYFIQFIILYI